MLLYRFCRNRRANDLTGTGSKLIGGRWNSKGIAVLYTSKSPGMALLEYWVHVKKDTMPREVCIVEIEVPEREIIKINKRQLPSNWRDIPGPKKLQKLGDIWVREEKSLVLKVHSVVLPIEYNYILNPKHEEMKKVVIKSISDYEWDPRILKAV